MDLPSPSTRAAKRQRTELREDGRTLPTRADPWFPDGTIVLEADNRQFRVHKGILSTNSQIFRDMLDLPQPGSASADGDFVGECPVVHMSDAWWDLQHVLKALYNRSYHGDPRIPMPFEVVAAFLRLGRKYDIAHIQAEAMARLTTEYLLYPTQLDAALHAHEDPSAVRIYQIAKEESRSKAVGCAIAAIGLAYETQTFCILPAAYYRLCVMAKLDEILDGCAYSDSAAAAILPPEHLKCYLRGRDAVVEAQIKEVYPWLDLSNPHNPVHDCATPGLTCRELAMQMYACILVPIRPKIVALESSPPEFLDEAMSVLCRSCRHDAFAAQAVGWRKVWDKLPSYFDLPEWDVLLKD